MALRYMEVRLTRDLHDEAESIIDGHEVIESTCVPAGGDDELHRFLLEKERVEPLVDAFRSRFGDDIRIVIMAVEATLPREGPEPDAVPLEQPEPKAKASGRISREELYEDIAERTTLNPVFLALAGISALVACIGLARDDQVALIGAMVIAPLLGPNVGLALSSTLGDLEFGRRALKTGMAGIGASFLVAVAFGVIFGAPETVSIAERALPEYAHIGLALASGVAGALAFTTGLPASLIGVMVAVALMPPLAAGGMLLGDGQADRSIGAFLLLGINLVAVNLAGVATFLVQGVRPIWGSEQPRARRAARTALATWTVLLALLVGGLVWVQERSA